MERTKLPGPERQPGKIRVSDGYIWSNHGHVHTYTVRLAFSFFKFSQSLLVMNSDGDRSVQNVNPMGSAIFVAARRLISTDSYYYMNT